MSSFDNTIITNSNDTRFVIEIENGPSFSKLFTYLKFSSDSVIRLTKNSMTYNELITKQIEGSNKKSYLNINNTIDFDVKKFKMFIFDSPNPEYNLFINVKSFQERVGKIIKNNSIKIYKESKDEHIYIQTSDNTADSEGISFITPLNMQNCEIFTHPSSTKDEDNPNCTINLKKFKMECSKISSNEHKQIKLIGYNKRMEIHAVSENGLEGHIFKHSNTNNVITDGAKIDLKKIKINGFVLNTSNDDYLDLDNHPILINLSVNLLKNISRLTQISDYPFKVFFEKKENYIKIITSIKEYAKLTIYIQDNQSIDDDI